ncbi:MAG TPA: DUF5919 domain-containing protein [Polyangiaceae bacterium]|nr:DUF5919 domain-containing protein [Polyangiaceae bacterium]
MKLPSLKDVVLPALGVAVALLAVSPAALGQNAAGYGDYLRHNWWWIVAVASPIASVAWTWLYSRHRPTAAPPNENGIRAFPDRQDKQYQHLLTEALSRAKSVDVVGVSNNRLTSDVNVEFYRDLLLSRKGRIRALFLAPNSPAIREREQLEGRQRGSLSGLVQHNIEDLRRFARTLGLSAEFAGTQLAVRTVSFFAGINVIICDNQLAFVHYYGRNTRGFDCPALVFDSTRQRELNFFTQEFESLWSSGTDEKIA